MAAPPKPTLKERGRQMICPECGGPVTRKSEKGRCPTFCKRECKVAHQNRRTARGVPLAALVQAWRVDRGQGEIAKAAFAEICAIADSFNAEDLEAGRPRADLYASKLLRDGFLFLDRQR